MIKEAIRSVVTPKTHTLKEESINCSCCPDESGGQALSREPSSTKLLSPSLS